jgi:hypothetical protein
MTVASSLYRSAALTMPHKPSRSRFNKFGYGALALYALAIVVTALGVYGINVTSIVMSQSTSDRAREKVKTGRMVIGTDDRTQCRSLHFNNETQELSAETLAECDLRLGSTGSSGGSFGIFRDGFVNR